MEQGNTSKIDSIRNIVIFLTGAVILILETELRYRDSRPWVIGLALLLMGVVTYEQIADWIKQRHLK